MAYSRLPKPKRGGAHARSKNWRRSRAGIGVGGGVAERAGRRGCDEACEWHLDAHTAGCRPAVGLGYQGVHAESESKALQHRQGQAAVGPAGVQPYAEHVQPRAVLPDGAALRLHVVRDAAFASPIRRGREDDACVPRCWRHADDPHARCAGSQHAEGVRPGHPRDHRPDRRRRVRSERRGPLGAVSADRQAQPGRQPVLEQVPEPWRNLPELDRRQRAQRRDDRDR